MNGENEKQNKHWNELHREANSQASIFEISVEVLHLPPL